ncbi:hypothetical protein DPMN_062065 [Dreissena polymorpha]|uniref:Uncharacterized protein n=3 Tax=Dreissena polymorpha TaxID=45954 RepID=A0A9D4C934_DREPO|nr:hypothetical protein DPMN_062065 [Dreissena polymorpha]
MLSSQGSVGRAQVAGPSWQRAQLSEGSVGRAQLAGLSWQSLLEELVSRAQLAESSLA